MRDIQDFPNVAAPGGDYTSFGNIKDRVIGVSAGTPFNVLVFSDLFQFLMEMVANTSVTPDGTADNDTNGFQLMDALVELLSTNDPVTFTSIGGIDGAFVNVAADPGQFLFDGFRKSVRLYGMLRQNTGTPSSPQTICTLPAGSRPPRRIAVHTIASDTVNMLTTDTNYQPITLWINSDGTVQQAIGIMNNNDYINLNNLTIPIA